MKAPFFSIITSVYNKEKYIKQCISSVINQTFGDFEFIIADDCSTDNTLNILENFCDDRIKLIKMPENKGVSCCRNECLLRAKGRYIFFVDGDDMLELSVLERAKNELEKNPCDILFFPYRLYIEEKKRLKRFNSKRSLKALRLYDKPIDVQKEGRVFFDLNYEIWNKIFDRNFLIDNQIKFKEDLGFSEDFVFYCEILKYAKTATYIEKEGYYYRFFAAKNFSSKYVTEQFEKAFCYTKDIIVDKWGEEFFIEKISSILNYWIIKLNYDKNLYALACKLCQNKGVLDINRKMQRGIYALFCKIKNFL